MGIERYFNLFLAISILSSTAVKYVGNNRMETIIRDGGEEMYPAYMQRIEQQVHLITER